MAGTGKSRGPETAGGVKVAGRLRAGEFTPGRLRGGLLRLSQWRLDLAGRLARAFEHERDTGSLFNFAPVALGLGILTYFTLASEPVAPVVWASALAAAALAWRLESRGAAYLAAVAVALFFIGMGAAQLRTSLTETPLIARQMSAELTGLVLAVDRNARGSPRYLIRPTAIAGLKEDGLPRHIRLSASAGKERFAPGDAIAGKARLMPFSGPAYPGGYDFGFFASFDRLGGTGFFLGAPHRGGVVAPWAGEKVAIALNRLRLALGERIRAGLAGEPGDVAVALITGDRSGIDKDTADSLRRSGLAHVLAISGLHMALVALAVVWSLRWLLAWFPPLVLNRPVGKWAAAAGLGAATCYLVISGASVATQRAWIMIAVMLTATLADRRAITIRNVAVAAIVILVLSPESVLEPGFQMSFAAAAALVAAYEAWRRRRMGRRGNTGHQTLPARLLRAVPVYFGGILFTSLVAGLATGLFAAWHFHRVAPLGLVANMLAMPVVSLVMMPFALLSMLAMPYGLERPFLAVFGWGIERMIAISDWVNGFDIDGTTGIQPVSVLATGAAGLVLLTLLKSRLRLVGLLPLAALPFLVGGGPTPDILAAEDGRTIAVADGQRRLVLLYPRRNRFVTDIWLRAWSAGVAGKAAGVVGPCDRESCTAKLRTGRVLEVVYDPDLLKAACGKADILLAPRLRWVHCHDREPRLILKRGDFEAGGSQAIWLKGEPPETGTSSPPAAGETAVRIRVTPSRTPGTRPWNRPAVPATAQ